MTGRPAFGDSCWLFQVSKGKLNTYSIYPQKGTIYISAVTRDPQTDPIRINQANIIQLVQDNPKALKFAGKMKLMRAINAYNFED